MRNEAIMVLSNLSENSEMAIRMRKYGLLDPLLTAISREDEELTSRRIALKTLANLIKLEDNQRFFMESPR